MNNLSHKQDKIANLADAELEVGQWIELPSGSIVAIRKVTTVTTTAHVVTVREVNEQGRMACGSFDLSLDHILENGKIVKKAGIESLKI